MSIISKQDTNGIKPLLQVGELGYDNYPAGGDKGRVFVGTGTENIGLANKTEVMVVDSKADTHIARVDNPHNVTKTQVGLGNVDNTSDVNKPISTATQNALNLKADAANAALTGVPTAPTASVGTNTTQLATTAYVKAEVANETYSKTQLNNGQLDNRYFTETELLNGALDVRYYTETEVDAKLAGQNDASEITVVPTGNLTSTNVQAALVELQGDIDNRYTKTQADTLLAGKVDDSEIASVNLLRADKYLSAQNIANMVYTDGNLVKIQYNNAVDEDYEVFGYTNGNLSSIDHYIGTVLKGTTTFGHAGGNLVSSIYEGV